MEWMKSLSPQSINRISERINRIPSGNLGDHKRIGSGLFELRLFFEGGLRVYFGRDGNEIIVLLCGGGKKTQQRDIEKAQAYWRRYYEQKSESV